MHVCMYVHFDICIYVSHFTIALFAFALCENSKYTNERIVKINIMYKRDNI